MSLLHARRHRHLHVHAVDIDHHHLPPSGLHMARHTYTESQRGGGQRLALRAHGRATTRRRAQMLTRAQWPPPSSPASPWRSTAARRGCTKIGSGFFASYCNMNDGKYGFDILFLVCLWASCGSGTTPVCACLCPASAESSRRLGDSIEDALLWDPTPHSMGHTIHTQ